MQVHDGTDHLHRNRGCFDPVAGFGEDFEPSVRVLDDESEAFEIGMCADAELIGG